ncbi:MAG: GTP-binding protein [Flavobacteriales bacterium]|nr:GTP-binding protein [Flavobacteriales bacterium]
MNIVRLSTAGSVDDGKSTLIGRLLYDTNSLSKDKVANIEQISQQRGLDQIDLSLITDGLTAEREQGITIDVAHIYFNTPKRKYIIADTPGHVEYTRNMITGASNADVFIILIDARKGIIEQTKRHLFIASLMEIKEIAFVINKIDLVDYEQDRFLQIRSQIEELKERFELLDKKLSFFPVSAKIGDNVVNLSGKTPWYKGETLLSYLEQLKIEQKNQMAQRFNVQYVIRPHSDDFHDYRAYAGKVKSGTFEIGDEVKVLSTGQSSRIKAINRYKDNLLKATEGQSVALELETDIDISRGDILTLASDSVEGDKSLSARLCWLGKEELSLGRKYLLQHGASRVPVKVTTVNSQINFETLEFDQQPLKVDVNSINQIELKSASPLFIDSYKNNPANGYFILIDETANTTVAVGFKN